MGSGMMAALDGGGAVHQAGTGTGSGMVRGMGKLPEPLPAVRVKQLGHLNQNGGRWVAVSETMWAMLIVAQELEQLSAGLVTATMGGVLESFGYDRSFELVATLLI